MSTTRTAPSKRKARAAKTLFDAEFAGGLPAFDSMEQCAAQACIPKSIQREAKRKGCPAFKSNRVYLRPLLQWIFAADKSDRADWKHHYEKFNALIRELEFKNKSDELIEKSEVRFGMSRAMNALFSILDRYAECEWPPALRGLEAQEISTKVKTGIEEIKKEFRGALQNLMDEKEPAQLAAPTAR